MTYNPDDDYRAEAAEDARLLHRAKRTGKWTKATELLYLKEVARNLGQCSYMGPWLNDQLPFIETALRSDMPPSTISSANKVSNDIVTKAQADAEAIVQQAERKAAAMIEEARATKNNILIRFRSDLRKAGIIG